LSRSRYFRRSSQSRFASWSGTGTVLEAPVRSASSLPARYLFGQELFDAAKEGQITEASYMFPKPGADMTPVAKISLVTRVGDLGCGVGYYK
jgi:hypothetical protein